MTRDYYKEACEAYLKACEGIKAESTLTVSTLVEGSPDGVGWHLRSINKSSSTMSTT